jgi:hypothetical protein
VKKAPLTQVNGAFVFLTENFWKFLEFALALPQVWAQQ